MIQIQRRFFFFQKCWWIDWSLSKLFQWLIFLWFATCITFSVMHHQISFKLLSTSMTQLSARVLIQRLWDLVCACWTLEQIYQVEQWNALSLPRGLWWTKRFGSAVFKNCFYCCEPQLPCCHLGYHSNMTYWIQYKPLRQLLIES